MSDDTYRDDPEHFGQSADSTRDGPGLGKPQDQPSTGNTVVAGSADWKDGVGPLGDASPLNDERHDTDATALDAEDQSDDEPVRSRSADPGQSSFGGFKDQ